MQRGYEFRKSKFFYCDVFVTFCVYSFKKDENGDFGFAERVEQG